MFGGTKRVVAECANVGAEPGMRVVVVYDSGMGLVAYRATVKEKKR